MKKMLLNALAVLFVVQMATARPRTAEKALSVAKTFISGTQGANLRSGAIRPDALQLAYTSKGLTKSVVDTAVYYYVLNFNNNQGFILVSGDDRAYPVLGYSDSGNFDIHNLPDNFRYWLSFYESQLRELAETPETAVPFSLDLPVQNANQTAFATQISPLLKTNWNQDAPYNDQCPSTTGGAATYTGCVATAMAQIMKYHNYPNQGAGSHSYTTRTLGLSQSANFGNTAYDWTNMANNYSSSSSATQKAAVATLMHHCGVSVNMDYNSTASGAYSEDVAEALVTYFGYDAGADYYDRDYYTASEWTSIIKTDLNASRPVYYSGSSSGGGHAFVCDGYDANGLFHFNWGWGGSSNGYFELSALNPSSLGIGGGSGGYNRDQGIVAGIRPSTGSSSTSGIQLSISGVSASKTTLASLSESFNITVSKLYNTGGKTVSSVNLGVLLCNQNDSIIKYDGSSYSLGLPSGNYFINDRTVRSNYTLSSSLSPGTYRLYPAYVNPAGADTVILKGKNGKKYYINIVLSAARQATLSVSTDIMPALSLQSLSTTGSLYQNTTGRFTARVTNNGTGDYNSNLIIYLQNTTSSSNSQIVCNDPVVIPAGETRDISFSGTVDRAAGSYYLTVMYDANNDRQAFSSAIQLGNYQTITVNPTPSEAPNLTLTAPVSFPDKDNVNKNNAELTVKVKNTGGLFEDEIITFVFPTTGGNSLTYIGYRSIIIDKNEEQTLILRGPVDLPPGQYQVIVYWYNANSTASSKWTAFTPDNYRGINPFTLVELATSLEINRTETFTVYPNPAGDVLHVRSVEPIRSIAIYDLSGNKVRQEQTDAGNITVPIENLKKGVYLLRIETGTDVKTSKFSKK